MGFYVPEPDAHQAPLPDLVGPIIRLGVCTSNKWNAAVLVAYRCSSVARESNPVTCEWKLEPTAAQWTRLRDCVTLGTHKTNSSLTSTSEPGIKSGPACEWQFIRFTLPTVPLQEAQVLQYRLSVNSSVAVSASIPIPALGEEWRVVAYSCYDQRRGLGGALWKNITDEKNKGKPVHALLGGGDQLYNDNVWMLDPLQEWLEKKDPNRLVQEPSEQTKHTVTDFYVGSYLRFIHFHPAAELLRSTPQVSTHDDHDHFDGWGSYPKKLQHCPLFTAIFQQSQRCYLIFQLGTTVELAASDGFFVVPPLADRPFSAVNFATQLGPSLAVVVPDSRSQRSKEQILSDGQFKWLISAMKQFPKEVQHVLLLSAIPMLYPGLGIVESLLKFFNHRPAKMLFKTGLYDSIYNHFDQPDLLDDVTDHWSSSVHAAEKVKLLEAFASVAKQCGVRVSIASGDVHLCALGYMQSKGQPGRVQALDPGFITQIVTSAIGNKPPGNMVVSYIESCTKVKSVGEAFQEGMAEFFDPSKTPGGKSARFNNRQNYCELRVEKPAGALPASPGSLRFKFVVLGGDPIEGDEIGDVVASHIPPLLPPGAPKQLVNQYPGLGEVPAPKLQTGRRWFCCC